VQVEPGGVEPDTDHVGPSRSHASREPGRVVALRRSNRIDRVSAPGAGTDLDSHPNPGIVDEKIDLATVDGHVGGDDAQSL
jgi:hypothetical protein